jgi:thiol-disulfide isomerase/thioredoxin
LPEGTPVSLDDLTGKVVLVNFWGTWCPPCVKEFPTIAAIQKQYQERADFRVLAVSCGTAADDETKIGRVRTDTRAFLDQWSARYPEYLGFRALLDQDQTTRRAVREVTEWPTAPGSGDLVYPVTLLLDRKHRLRFKWVGPASHELFTEQIEKVLNE